MNEDEVSRMATEQMERDLDRYIDTNSAIWNILFAANAAAVPIASILAGISGRTPLWIPAIYLSLSAAASVVGCGCVLRCFDTTRNHYREQICLGSEPPAAVMEATRVMNEMDRKTAGRHASLKKTETMARIAVIVNYAIVIIAAIVAVYFNNITEPIR
jgi:hypothetical protein